MSKGSLRPPGLLRCARNDSGVANAPSRRPAEPSDGRVHADELALAAATSLQLHLSVGEALRADDDLMRRASQVHGRELAPRPLVAVVVEHVDARLFERAVDAPAGPVARRIADFQV